MKCNQSRPGFELVSPCPFPTTITIRHEQHFNIFRDTCFYVLVRNECSAFHFIQPIIQILSYNRLDQKSYPLTTLKEFQDRLIDSSFKKRKRKKKKVPLPNNSFTITNNSFSKKKKKKKKSFSLIEGWQKFRPPNVCL